MALPAACGGDGGRRPAAHATAPGVRFVVKPYATCKVPRSWHFAHCRARRYPAVEPGLRLQPRRLHFKFGDPAGRLEATLHRVADGRRRRVGDWIDAVQAADADSIGEWTFVDPRATKARLRRANTLMVLVFRDDAEGFELRLGRPAAASPPASSADRSR